MAKQETFPGFRIEDGFVIGTRWDTGKGVMIGVHGIERISLDCGNSPPADRVYFLNDRIPHIDLKRITAEGETIPSASDAELEDA
jgi:hypothetical protein